MSDSPHHLEQPAEGRTRVPDELPLVTVVTVTFNAASDLERTIKSVAAQTYPALEYIVIDGGSKDGTVEVLKRWDDHIAHWVSEPDAGIYDAMRKGLELATGQWINFMNAGDGFYDTEVVRRIFGEHEWLGRELIYGNHVIQYSDGRKRDASAKSVSELWRGMIMSHQSLFAPLSLVRQLGFDECWGTAADYAFLAAAYQQRAPFVRVPGLTVATYQAGGVSDVQRLRSLRSAYRAAAHYALAPRWKLLSWYGTRMLVEGVKMPLKALQASIISGGQ